MTANISETFQDHLLAFSIPARDARGRVVRLNRTVETILAAHDYPASIKQLLAEALVVTALVGGLAKAEGSQMTMQAQTQDGVISLLVCDFRDGELRGYVQFDADKVMALGARPALPELFGKGYLALTFDLALTGQRYQGIVPLEGSSLAKACESYFAQSEQVPTLIRVAVDARGDLCVAGGLLVQHLPEGEAGRDRLHTRMDHPEWDHVAIMAGSITDEELTDCSLSLEGLVWRLFHEEQEVRVQPSSALSRGCRCSVAHFEEVLARFPSEDRAAMRDDKGIIMVDCAFCSRLFPIQD